MKKFLFVAGLIGFSFSLSLADTIKSFEIEPKYITIEPYDLSREYNEEYDKLMTQISSENKVLDILDKKFDKIIEDITKRCVKDEKFISVVKSYLKLIKVLSSENYIDKDYYFKLNPDFFIKVVGTTDIKGFIKEQQGSLFIEELLLYYKKIRATKGWEEKLKKMGKELKKLEKSQDRWLYEIVNESGFEPNSNECYRGNITYDDRANSIYYSGYQTTLDSYFYSFWARRYLDNTMELTKKMLEELIK